MSFVTAFVVMGVTTSADLYLCRMNRLIVEQYATNEYPLRKERK